MCKRNKGNKGFVVISDENGNIKDMVPVGTEIPPNSGKVNTNPLSPSSGGEKPPYVDRHTRGCRGKY